MLNRREWIYLPVIFASLSSHLSTPSSPLCSLSLCSGDPAAEEWSQWSVCSLTCGQGWQVRTRSCVSSPYGTLCSGALRETRMCNNTASCPGEPGITGSGMSARLSVGCPSPWCFPKFNYKTQMSDGGSRIRTVVS